MSYPSQLALSPIPLPEIIQRYAEGASVQDLAQTCNVSRQALYNWILGGLGDQDYFDLVTRCLIRRISEADDKLEAAQDKLDITRWIAVGKFARHDFERRRPTLYGSIRPELNAKILVLVNRDQAVKQLDTTTPSEQTEPE